MTGLSCSKDSNMNEEMPDTLLGFGYEFKDGKLSNIENGESFQFVVREGDQAYNQKHYEALGEVITEEVYKLLESECNLKKAPVPFDAKEERSTFIFQSEDALTNEDKLIVLIHGSGVVRAGQWARRLIINESLESGTQIPFIKEAQKEGYGVIVMNTNDNRMKMNEKTKQIRGSEMPEEHALHVWNHYVRKAKAKHIAVIAHSYGGCVTTTLFQEEKQDFLKRVFAVAMTDSVHYISRPEAFRGLIKISCNWVSSQKPLDTPLNSMLEDIKRVSAGVNVHEQTSWSSFRSVFNFLKKRYDAVTKGGEEENTDEGEADAGAVGNGKAADDGTRALSRDLSMRTVVGDGDGCGGGDDDDNDDGVVVEDYFPEEGDDVTMKEPKGVHDMSDSEGEERGEDNKKIKVDKSKM